MSEIPTPHPLRPRAGRRLGRWLGGCVVLLGAACGKPAPTGRPDVLLIVVDTLRADVLDVDEASYDTPNLDALAADGTLFRRAYSHAPMTLPSHVSLFSSRPPIETGILTNVQKVPADLPLLAEWMGEFGYRTGAVISLGTLQRTARAGGLERGFETYDDGVRMLATAEGVQPRILECLADLAGERPRVGEVAASSRRPFLLFAHYSDPHEPYRSHGTEERWATARLDGEELTRLRLDEAEQWVGRVHLDVGVHRVEIESEHRLRGRAVRAKGRWGRPVVTFPEAGLRAATDRFSAEIHVGRDTGAPGEYELFLWASDLVTAEEARERYRLEVAHVDRYVGELLEELRARGTYDDSLVVLVSDHGEALGKPGERGHVGHVKYLYDPLIRVPLIVKPPKGSELERRLAGWRDEPVSLIDLAPTILAACGLPELPGQQGVSFQEPGRRVPFEHLAETHRPEAPADRVALLDGRYKMVYVLGEDAFSMFDLEADPSESEDRFEELWRERLGWPERLRDIARFAAGREGAGATTEERFRMLQALGYGGGE